jgi:ribosome recycling factor
MDVYNESMGKRVTAFKAELEAFRIGRAHPGLLESVIVKVGEKSAPLSQIAMINVKDARTLMVVVSDEGLVKSVEKAIRSAELNFNPVKMDSTVLKVPVPRLSDVYRAQLIKQLGQLAEKTRTRIRASRADARGYLKKLKLRDEENRAAEKLIQERTDEVIKQVDTVLEAKQKDLNKA